MSAQTWLAKAVGPAPLGRLPWRSSALALLGVGQALLLVWGSGTGSTPGRQLAAVLAAALAGLAALLWLALDRRFERFPLVALLGLALLLRLVAVQATPLLEDDHHRYLWDGMRTATGLDPYRLPPAAYFTDTRLPALWQGILSGINHPDVPTIYGPVLQALFALAWSVAPGRIEAIQGLLLIADMAVLLVLVQQGLGRRWLLAYALHPLVLKEAMASAHPDGLVALFLLLAVAAWQRRRVLCMGVMLGLAVATKVVAVLALPLLLLLPPLVSSTGLNWRPPWAAQRRWAMRAVAAFGATLVLLYAPFLWAGGSDAAALRTFGNEWRFNPLLYRWIEALAGPAAARPLAFLLLVLGISLLTWGWMQALRRTTGPHVPPLDKALALLLLLSPVVNPWYWLWVLALAAWRGSGGLLAMAAIAVLSYLNSTVIAQAGLGLGLVSSADIGLPYLVPWWLALPQTALLAWVCLPARPRPPQAWRGTANNTVS